MVVALGKLLDRVYAAFWSRPDAVIPLLAQRCGTALIPRFQLHAALAAMVLAQEAANGMNSASHPWAARQADGSFAPAVPAGWTITPVVDANGQPTGAATVSKTP